MVGHVEGRHLHDPAVIEGARGRDGDLQRNPRVSSDRAKISYIHCSMYMYPTVTQETHIVHGEIKITSLMGRGSGHVSEKVDLLSSSAGDSVILNFIRLAIGVD